MANDEDVLRIRQGPAVWNTWRAQNPVCRVDLRGAELSGWDLHKTDLRFANLGGANLHDASLGGADLFGANLRDANLHDAILGEANLFGADLGGANLRFANLIRTNLGGANLAEADLTDAMLAEADFYKANLERADLSGANLSGANLREADLSGADLGGANLRKANLGGADLSGADLGGADLDSAILVKTNLTDADLTGCRIYGISAWDLKLEGAEQRDLVITESHQPQITVDNIEVGQFIYLLLNNEKIRDVIDTIGKKGVLLLGRFTEGRLAVLERLRTELRKRDFLPLVFNFDKPETKDFTETVRLLAGLSRFVIVDITNPRSAPLELQATVPEYMIPFVPILEKGEEPFAMFKDLWIKHSVWVLDPIRYPSVDRLVEVLDTEIVKPAEARFVELLARKSEGFRIKDI